MINSNPPIDLYLPSTPLTRSLGKQHAKTSGTHWLLSEKGSRPRFARLGTGAGSLWSVVTPVDTADANRSRAAVATARGHGGQRGKKNTNPAPRGRRGAPTAATARTSTAPEGRVYAGTAVRAYSRARDRQALRKCAILTHAGALRCAACISLPRACSAGLFQCRFSGTSPGPCAARYSRSDR